MIGTAGLQDNDITFKISLIGYLSLDFLRIKENFLRVPQTLAYRLSFLQKLG